MARVSVQVLEPTHQLADAILMTQVSPLLRGVPDRDLRPEQLLSLSAASCGLRHCSGLEAYGALCILSLQDNKLSSLNGQVSSGVHKLLLLSYPCCLLRQFLGPVQALPKTLLHLNLSGNALTSFIGLELPNLVCLDASSNQLQVGLLLSCSHSQQQGPAAPAEPPLCAQSLDSLTACPALCQASFADNAIHSVEGLSHCKKLTTLDLSGNRLSTVLEHRPLALLSNLKSLVLTGNPGQVPRSMLRSLMPGGPPVLLFYGLSMSAPGMNNGCRCSTSPAPSSQRLYRHLTRANPACRPDVPERRASARPPSLRPGQPPSHPSEPCWYWPCLSLLLLKASLTLSLARTCWGQM